MMILTTGSVFNSAIELITVIIIFVFVLLVTYYVTKWIAGYQKEHMRQGNLVITEAIRLPGNKYIEIIRAGEDKYLVVGVGKNELTLLATLTKEEIKNIPEGMQSQSANFGNFADAFADAKKALQKKLPKK